MKIAIAGYGIEGKENYEYWSKMPEHTVVIVDELYKPKLALPDGAKTMLGPDSFSQLNGFDMVIRTAGLAPYKIVTDGKIWSATNEFMTQCPVPVIGVTGTKGKGTTATLITSLLRAGGKTVHLVGNIGTSALASLPFIQKDDLVVFEMSSFQLWDAETSPHIAVVLGIEPDHLNVHKSMEDYVLAKGEIRHFQKEGDLCVYHWSNIYSKQIADENTNGSSIRYGIEDDGGVYVKDGDFYQREHKLCSVDRLHVPGQHNIENAVAALTVAAHFGLTNQQLASGLENFNGLPHRLEKVREHAGVTYYNDSFSSSPSATIAAIRSFQQPLIVIIGGADKGADFSELAALIGDAPNIKEVVLIGERRHELERVIGGQPTVFDGKTMDEIVAYVSGRATDGDVVLLSPGCASFDMFRDFYDRGDQFREKVLSL